MYKTHWLCNLWQLLIGNVCECSGGWWGGEGCSLDEWSNRWCHNTSHADRGCKLNCHHYSIYIRHTQNWFLVTRELGVLLTLVFMATVWTINEPHLPKKKRPRCYVKSPTAQDVFRLIPRLISYTGVTGRWGLLSHAQNAVSWLALSKTSISRSSSKAASLRAVVLCAAIFCSKVDHNRRVLSMHKRLCAHIQSAGGTRSIIMYMAWFEYDSKWGQGLGTTLVCPGRGSCYGCLFVWRSSLCMRMSTMVYTAMLQKPLNYSNTCESRYNKKYWCKCIFVKWRLWCLLVPN